jgi:hypothetical protein
VIEAVCVGDGDDAAREAEAQPHGEMEQRDH